MVIRVTIKTQVNATLGQTPRELMMLLLWCCALGVALCLSGAAAQSGPEADLVTSLPGLAQNPSFRHYSGYVQAGQGKQFHYW